MILQATWSIFEARKSFLPWLHHTAIESKSLENTFKIIKSNCLHRATPCSPSNHLHFHTRPSRLKPEEKGSEKKNSFLSLNASFKKKKNQRPPSMIAYQSKTQYIEKKAEFVWDNSRCHYEQLPLCPLSSPWKVSWEKSWCFFLMNCKMICALTVTPHFGKICVFSPNNFPNPAENLWNSYSASVSQMSPLSINMKSKSIFLREKFCRCLGTECRTYNLHEVQNQIFYVKSWCEWKEIATGWQQNTQQKEETGTPLHDQVTWRVRQGVTFNWFRRSVLWLPSLKEELHWVESCSHEVKKIHCLM